jgi:hypothetical protein
MEPTYKVDIIYLKHEGSYFEWDHYLAVHCGLALETTSRFARFTHYDVSRPLDEAASPFHCLATVFFENRAELDKFLAGLTSDAFQTAFADQINYTNTTPQLVPGIHHQWGDAKTRLF